MDPIVRTEAQRIALGDYNAACRELAKYAKALSDAQSNYEIAMQRYMVASGAAQALGVV